MTFLIPKLKRLFPFLFGCEVIKNDPNYRQGILDLTLAEVWGPHWAMLEVKASATAKEQPNQGIIMWGQQMNDMSFAAFIYPENEEEVLAALQDAFASRGATCVS
jgi:hypothetical protein